MEILWIGGEKGEIWYFVDYEILLERIIFFESKEFFKVLDYFVLFVRLCNLIGLIENVWDGIWRVFLERFGVSLGIFFFVFFVESGEDEVFLKENKEYFEKKFELERD